MTRYAIVTHEFTFEASHSVPGSRGQCQHPHGHTYRLQVAWRGPILESPSQNPDDPRVVDVEDLKHRVKMLLFMAVPGSEISGGLNYNDLDALSGIRTTAENLVHWIWDALVAAGVPDDLLYRVRLWETEEGYAEITHRERESTASSGYNGF
jgi:6-pyruvoyltetrahydropterin/6-carboxytetrahydropterin synthase